MLKLDKRTRGLIAGAIKRVWRRHPVRLELMQNVRIEDPKLKKDGTPAARPDVFYICSQCGGKAKAQRSKFYPQAHVDHIDPVVPIGTSFDDMSWDHFIERLFCEASNLQVLCADCHKTKTLAENRQRKVFK